MPGRVLALFVLLATVLFGTGAGPRLYRCAMDGEVHAERCCDERKDGHACCQPVASEQDADDTQVPAAPTWEAPAPVTLSNSGWTLEATWIVPTEPNPAVQARGPPRCVGPPFYLRHCSLLI